VEALGLALAIGETAVVWLVTDLALGSARAGDRAQIAPVAVFILIFAAVAVPRWLEALNVWEPWYQVATVGAIIATTLAAVKLICYPAAGWLSSAWVADLTRAVIVRPNDAAVPVWGVIAISVYAWWRGRHHDEPSLDTAYLLLRAGTVVVVGAVIFRSVTVSENAARGSASGVVIFFAATLSAIAIARMQQERVRGVAMVGAGWIPAFLGPVALIALLAVAAVGFFSRDVLDTLLWVLAPLVWALSVVFRLLVLTIALLAFIIVSPILWLLSGRTLDVAGVRINGGPIGVREITERGADHAAEIPDPIRYLIALVALSFFFSIAIQFVLRGRRRQRGVLLEERESMASAGDLLAAAAARVRRLLSRSPREPDGLDQLRSDARWAHTVAIRETYRRFLVWSQDQQVPRGETMTPLEHSAVMAPLVRSTGLQDDLTTLTERYNEARYGAGPATGDDADQARVAWQRLRHAPERRRS
jgi:hypothetical protein